METSDEHLPHDLKDRDGTFTWQTGWFPASINVNIYVITINDAIY